MEQNESEPVKPPPGPLPSITRLHPTTRKLAKQLTDLKGELRLTLIALGYTPDEARTTVREASYYLNELVCELDNLLTEATQ